MGLFRKKLNRQVLLDKLHKYCLENKINDSEYYKKYIYIIENEFEKSQFINDSDFLIKGRRKFLIDEFFNVLNNSDNYNKINYIEDPLYFALGNLQEILSGNNMISFEDVEKEKWEIQENGNYKIDGIYVQEIRNIDERYNKKNIICLEEKQLIEEMIREFKNKINKLYF